MKWLLIAEKESAGTTFAKVLGADEKKDGYYEGESLLVTYAQGHLLGLKDPQDHNIKYKEWKVADLPLFFNNNNFANLKITNSRIFERIKTLIQREDVCGIINAGDPAREGELIQRWIYGMAGNKKQVVRLWCDTLTPTAILKAYQDLKDSSEFDTLFEAGEARAELDQFLGYNYTRLLTKTIAEDLTISYGRCQTPLLNEIIKRDLDIEKFVPVPYWELKAIFNTKESDYMGNLICSETHSEIKFETLQEAQLHLEKLEKKEQGIIVSYNKETKRKNPPLLYNLNELQKTMARKYGYDADKTLAIAQSLYDTHKIMSYPRTDSRYLSNDIEKEIPQILKSVCFGTFKSLVENILKGYELQTPKGYFNDKKVTDHHALIPAIHDNIEAVYQNLSIEEKNVFNAVANSIIAIYYPAYEYDSVEIITDVSPFSFLSKGTTIKNQGWKMVYGYEEGEEKKELPIVEIGETVLLKELNIKDNATKAKKYYTTETLLTLMNMYNIGTSATQANLIKELTEKKGINKIPYVIHEKDKYISTELSRKFINFVPDDLKSVEIVGIIDKKLNSIADGTYTKKQLLDEEIIRLKKNITLLSEDTREKVHGEKRKIDLKNTLFCPVCGGPLIKHTWGYGCSGYTGDKCKFSISNKKNEKTLTDKNIKDLLTKGKTDEIKGFKSEKGKKFDSKLVFTEGKVKFEFQLKANTK